LGLEAKGWFTGGWGSGLRERPILINLIVQSPVIWGMSAKYCAIMKKSQNSSGGLHAGFTGTVVNFDPAMRFDDEGTIASRFPT
jgi:hypothetical protein